MIQNNFTLSDFIKENKISRDTCKHKYLNENINKERCTVFQEPLPDERVCVDYVYDNKSMSPTIDTVISQLDKIRENNPDVEIIVETPDGTATCKIGEAVIYEGCRGELVFDAE